MTSSTGTRSVLRSKSCKLISTENNHKGLLFLKKNKVNRSDKHDTILIRCL